MEEALPNPAPRGAGRPRWRRRLLTGVGIAAVIVSFTVVLPKIADYGAVWDTIQDLSWLDLLLLALATALNLITYAPPYMVTLPGLRFGQAIVVTQASTASTYIAPGGVAVGIALTFGMLRAWGFAPAAVTLAVALASVWNQFFLLGSPALGLALVTLTGGANRLLQTVALIGLGVFVAAVAGFVAALSGHRPAHWIGQLSARIVNRGLRVVRRGPVGWGGPELVGFRARAVALLRKRWWMLTLATIAGQLTVFLVLLVTLRTLGVGSEQVTLIEAFAAWTIARLIGSLPLTPGGIGIVELGLTGTLIAFGGDHDAVVAAVLIYRFLTIVPTLVLGSLLGLTWRRHKTAVP